jgi:hypothetical protein
MHLELRSRSKPNAGTFFLLSHFFGVCGVVRGPRGLSPYIRPVAYI